LGSHGEPRDRPSLGFLLHGILVHLYAQGLQEAAVLRAQLRPFRSVAIAFCQADGGVEFQDDVVAMCAHSGDRAGNAVGFRNCVIDSMAKLAQQILEMIVKLQGWLPQYSCGDSRLTPRSIQDALCALSSKYSHQGPVHWDGVAPGMRGPFVAMCVKMASMSTVGQRTTRAEEPRGFRRLWRVFRQLFHEVVGASFAILALGWLNSALRAWTRDVAPWLIGVSVAVAAVFIAFAVSSFRRARQL